jgi:hypothetical protein
LKTRQIIILNDSVLNEFAQAAYGIATVRFDFTGLGSRKGDFDNIGVTGNVWDLFTAAIAVWASHCLDTAAILPAADPPAASWTLANSNGHGQFSI